MTETQAGAGLKRNLGDASLAPVQMDGASGASMAIMIGREHGAPNFAMRQFEVAPGGHTPRHRHDYEHEVIILSAGGGRVLLNGAFQDLADGDVLYVPADSEHQFQASGEEPLRFLCFVPATRNCGEDTPGS